MPKRSIPELEETWVGHPQREAAQTMRNEQFNRIVESMRVTNARIYIPPPLPTAEELRAETKARRERYTGLLTQEREHILARGHILMRMPTHCRDCAILDLIDEELRRG